MHEWRAVLTTTRNPTMNMVVLTKSIRIVKKHVALSKATVTIPYSAEAFETLKPGSGILIYRDGRIEFAGVRTDVELTWEAGDQGLIHADFVGHEHMLADKIVLPYPVWPANAQRRYGYWEPRDADGNPQQVAASIAMARLIEEQCTVAAHIDNRISFSSIEYPPAMGPVRRWSILWGNLLEELHAMSVASGLNLGVQVDVPHSGDIRFSITRPRDLSQAIQFSADLHNIAGFTYRDGPPTLTHAVVAGQGELTERIRTIAQASGAALMWQRRIWQYLDRRDTADLTELQQAATDAIREGAPVASATITLRESEATTYGRDWDIGDTVSARIGLPGSPTAATIVDVIREITLEVDEQGLEKITPVIGTSESATDRPSRTQQELTAIRSALSGLIARN